MKTKTKTKIINFIPLSILSPLNLQSDCFLNMVSNLKLDRFYNRAETSLFFVFRSILLKTVGVDPYQSMDFKTLEIFIELTLKELYVFKTEGFVNQENMESNKIFCIFRSFYPETKDIFLSSKKPLMSMCFELEHFHNLVILTIIYEMEKTLKRMSLNSLKTDGEKEEITILKNERASLQKTLSGGIRISLSKNRLVLLKRLYVGFDTEYRAVDSKTNQLLCYTTASLSECLLKIRDDTVDFSVKDGLFHIPITAPMIRTVVRLIRDERDKNDSMLEELKETLINQFEMIKLNNSDIVFKSKKLRFEDIQTNFVDLRQDSSLYSCKKLLGLITECTDSRSFDCFNIHLKNLKPTMKQECILMAHFTTADVSSFEDFNEIKKNFSVLSKSFLTLDRGLSLGPWRVFLRDTSLLSPTGMSLKSIGQLYSDLSLNKKELCPETVKNMDLFFELNPKEFKEYAVQDAKIVLWHALVVQDSHYELTKKYSVPVTLSSLASSFLTQELVVQGDGLYHPKTQNGLISIKDIPKIMTPSGVELSNDLHEYIDYFLGSYHGGRNESYIYGIVKGEFYDYDLPGAYPTAMAMLDYPDWNSKKMIGCKKGEDFLLEEGVSRILRSYTSLKIKFVFPSNVRFPNLPVRLDFSSIIFPLSGETFCTGHEFVLAMKLGCRIQIVDGVIIPFVDRTKKPYPKKVSGEIVIREPLIDELHQKYQASLKNVPETRTLGVLSENHLFLKKQLENKNMELSSPEEEEEEEYATQFFAVVKRLLDERLKYPKGSYMNLLYKFIANAGIGQMARGLNQKKRYDTQTNSTKIMPSGELVSPLFAGWITGNIRSTLSEIMNRIPESEIISSTTDGFITTEKDLDKIKPCQEALFSTMYYDTRKKLTGSGAILERKYYEPLGVISWRTRGQLGLSGGIKALTGYQIHEPIEQTIEKVNKSFKGSKQIPFMQKSLRSAKEIFIYGGHSTLKLNERSFNLKFDNRREITVDCNGYHQTKPYLHKNNSIQNRHVSSLGTSRYRVYSPVSSTQCKGDAFLDLTRRMLVRLLRTDWKMLNEPGFHQLSRIEIQKLLKKTGLVCSKNFISKQKGLRVIFNSIPNTPKTKKVLENFSVIFPNFCIMTLFR